MPSMEIVPDNGVNIDPGLSSNTDGLQETLSRVQVQYENLSDRFYYKEKTYVSQYSQLYFSRLNQMRNRALSAAKTRWGEGDDVRYAERVLNAAKELDVDVVIIGVLFKYMDGKPSILKEYAKMDGQLIPDAPARSSVPYISERDSIIVEDETGRATLDLSQSKIDMKSMITGYVVSLRGRASKRTGSFQVFDVCQAGLRPQSPLSEIGDEKFICLVSGFEFGNPRLNDLAMDLFTGYIRGSVGDAAEEQSSARVSRIVIAGNLVCLPKDSHDGGWRIGSTSAMDEDKQRQAAAPIKEADTFLSLLSSAVPVDVMPGENDPTNYQLPQQPLHPCLLPSSSHNKLLHRVSNPYEFIVDKRRFLGCSGQNVDDYALYSTKDSAKSQGNGNDAARNSADRALQAMQSMLLNGLMAPTAPDTLSAYPFHDYDPFEIEATPHVFFAGNQASFGTRLVEHSTNSEDKVKVRVIAVPRFSETGQAVLVNLQSLECRLLEFSSAIPI